MVLLLLQFVTIKSGLPSPSTSQIATPVGNVPVVKSTFDANEMLPGVLIFLKTETVAPLPPPPFVTTMSGLPSPSRSQIATPNGIGPVVRSSFGAKELAETEPEMHVFLKMETVLLPGFTTTKSSLPSPSRSAIATPDGCVPVVKSTFDAKELVVIEPEVLVFLKTETVVPLPPTASVTTRSGLPSPSRSPMAIPLGFDPVVKPIPDPRDVASMIRELGKVTLKGSV